MSITWDWNCRIAKESILGNNGDVKGTYEVYSGGNCLFVTIDYYMDEDTKMMYPVDFAADFDHFKRCQKNSTHLVRFDEVDISTRYGKALAQALDRLKIQYTTK